MLEVILIGLALAALFCVLVEEWIEVSKAKVTLLCGCLAWLLLFGITPDRDAEALVNAFERNIAEIANLWLFLIAAMTFVAYLNHKGLVDAAIRRMLPDRLSQRGLMVLTGLFCFAFSSLADNITATLVSVALISSLQLSEKDLIKFSVLVVFAVNSGGVALISGDVTTLMIFLSGNVAITSLLMLSLPALASVMLLALMLSWNMNAEVIIERRGQRVPGSSDNRRQTGIRTVDIVIAILFLTTIISTMIGNVAFHVPPVLTFLTGLAVMFLVARFFKEDIDEDPILEYIRLVEFETLFFFLGVLLIVGMLQQIGALNSIASLYHTIAPLYANYGVGLISAAIDNVPLTAALLKANPSLLAADWLSLTYAVGVGGSLLIIGSAAGIVCMSKVKGLTVASYARYLPFVLVAYTAGYGGAVWISRQLLLN